MSEVAYTLCLARGLSIASLSVSWPQAGGLAAAIKKTLAVAGEFVTNPIRLNEHQPQLKN